MFEKICNNHSKFTERVVNMSKLSYIIKRLLSKKACAILNSKIDKRASVGNGSQIVESTIGKYSYAYNCSIIHAKIGAFCSIADGTVIGGGSHPINWVSSSPVFYSGRNVLKKNFSDNEYKEFTETIIGNDVWIGSKCLIKGGVTIGDGAVIGMGSVVTHDVPPYEIWAGNPAKFIRKRFDNETAEKLLNSKWWDLSDEELSDIGKYFNDIDMFLSKVQK